MHLNATRSLSNRRAGVFLVDQTGWRKWLPWANQFIERLSARALDLVVATDHALTWKRRCEPAHRQAGSWYT
jgi:hypothetical protein